MKRLLLDVDGVLADCSTPVHQFAQKLLRRPLPRPETWQHFAFDAAMSMTPEESRDFQTEILRSDVAWNVQFFPGAENLVWDLMEKFEVVFVTAGWKQMPAWVVAREQLLEQFRCPVIFTHDKHLVHGDLLVDDKPSNLMLTHAEAILFDAPYNQTHTLHRRIHSLKELL